MATSAAKANAFPRTLGFAVEAAVERSKSRALVAWFFAPLKLPTYPPLEYAQGSAAARAARLRHVVGPVDDLLTPLVPPTSRTEIIGKGHC